MPRACGRSNRRVAVYRLCPTSRIAERGYRPSEPICTAPLPDRERLEETSALLKVAGERLMAWVGTKVARAAQRFGETNETPAATAAAAGLVCFRQVEAVWLDLKQIAAAA